MVVSGVNALGSLGLRLSDIIPEMNQIAKDLLWVDKESPRVMNPRNLTDQRGRTGLLLEYSIPHIANRLLGGINAGYVTSNQFGDFYLTNNRVTLWIEAKSLDLDAEEYAANLATPLAWIPSTALMMVIVYQYQCDRDIRYPHVLDLGIFNARTVAKCRDFGWLVIGSKQILLDNPSYLTRGGKWKKEEGNLGKLGRIAKSVDRDLLLAPLFDNEEKREIESFCEFLHEFDRKRGKSLINRIAALVESKGVNTQSGEDTDSDLCWTTYSKNGLEYAAVMRYSDLSNRPYSPQMTRGIVSHDADIWIMITPKFGYSIYRDTQKKRDGKKINIESDDSLWSIISIEV